MSNQSTQKPITISSIVNSQTGAATGGFGGSNGENTITISYNQQASVPVVDYVAFVCSSTQKSTHVAPGSINETSLTTVCPASLSAGSYKVLFYHKAASIAGGVNSFTISAPANVTATTKGGKAEGPLAGGTKVTIEGKYLANAVNVFFGDTACEDFDPAANSDTKVVVNSPLVTSAGSTPISLTFPGSSDKHQVASFEYESAKFTLSGFYPNFASEVGAEIAIYGTGLSASNVYEVELWDESKSNQVASVAKDNITFAGNESYLKFKVPAGLSVNTEYYIAVVAADKTQKRYVNTTTPGAPMFSYVEPPKVPVTKVLDSELTDGSKLLTDLIFNNKLNVYSTGDFPDSGDLFIQTTNGVVVLNYTGVVANTSELNAGYYTGQFSGVNLYSDIPAKYQALGNFANSEPGKVLQHYASVFYAQTSQSFQLEFKIASYNATSGDLYYLGYYSTAVAKGGTPTFYYLKNGKKWHNCPINSTLTATQLTSVTNSLSLPLIPTNSANFVLMKSDSVPGLVTNSSAGVNRPTPYTSEGINEQVYDFVEFTLDGTAGDANVSLGTRFLPKLTIDTTQVDQLGLPISITSKADHVIPVALKTRPTTTHSPGNNVGVNSDLTMVDVFSHYDSFVAAHSDYSETLVADPNDNSKYLRLANPSDVLTGASDSASSPLNWAFDKVLNTLFTDPSGGSIILNTGSAGGLPSNTCFTGTATQYNGYQVLTFSSSSNAAAESIGSLYVYKPLFANNLGQSPNSQYYQSVDSPSWLPKPVSAGVMVLSNDGVFTDSGAQPGLTGEQQAVLANIENQLVAAINRGCALTALTTDYTNHTELWQDPQNHYPCTDAQNQYACFMHTHLVNGATVFHGITSPCDYGFAYAIAYDDQGSLSTTMTVVNDLRNTSVSIANV